MTEPVGVFRSLQSNVSRMRLTTSQEDDLFRPLLMVVHYLSPDEIGLLRRAFELSVQAHAGQFRMTGEPYVIHPIAVATICAERFLDVETLCAALLHDVLEDTGITAFTLESKFGKTITQMVEGLSKLNKQEGLSKQAAQAINLSKMLRAMKQDVRVILVKLADRLHNMRTLAAMSPEKRYRIGRETLDVYAPIAHRLGLFELYRELEDLSFQHCYPLRFGVLMRAVRTLGVAQEQNLRSVADRLKEALGGAGIHATVEHRIKHLWSLYRKMRDRHLPLHLVEDVFGLRVILKTEDECYRALGILHKTFLPIPSSFKDYIARPKSNGYQSLHTVLIGPQQIRLEVQVRTEQMHRVAEDGVAAHWIYKEGGALHLAQQLADPWLNKLLEVEASQIEDPLEYVDLIKTDLFPELIYVHTPKNEVKSLPRGSTVIDFAYAVHTHLGNHCIAAKVNREMVALRTVLKNGDQVEIIIAEHATPNPVWLGFVRTGRAKFYIRQALRRVQQTDLVRLGKSRLVHAAKQMQVELELDISTVWEKVLARLSCKDLESLWIEVGQGQLLPSLVVQQWLLAQGKSSTDKDLNIPLSIRGTEGLAVELSSCCTPVLGDLIVGRIRKHGGLVVHRQECPQVQYDSVSPKKLNSTGWLDLIWEENVPTEALYLASLRVGVKHVRNGLAQLVQYVSAQGVPIMDLSAAHKDGQQLELLISVQVSHLRELEGLMRLLKHQSWVSYVERLMKDKK